MKPTDKDKVFHKIYDAFSMMGGLLSFCQEYGLRPSTIEKIQNLVQDSLAVCFRENPD